MTDAKSIKAEPKGCGKWLRESDDYGFISCGDILEENEDNGKRELCPDCKKLNEQRSIKDERGYKL